MCPILISQQLRRYQHCCREARSRSATIPITSPGPKKIIAQKKRKLSTAATTRELSAAVYNSEVQTEKLFNRSDHLLPTLLYQHRGRFHWLESASYVTQC